MTGNIPTDSTNNIAENFKNTVLLFGSDDFQDKIYDPQLNLEVFEYIELAWEDFHLDELLEICFNHYIDPLKVLNNAKTFAFQDDLSLGEQETLVNWYLHPTRHRSLVTLSDPGAFAEMIQIAQGAAEARHFLAEFLKRVNLDPALFYHVTHPGRLFDASLKIQGEAFCKELYRPYVSAAGEPIFPRYELTVADQGLSLVTLDSIWGDNHSGSDIANMYADQVEGDSKFLLNVKDIVTFLEIVRTSGGKSRFNDHLKGFASVTRSNPSIFFNVDDPKLFFACIEQFGATELVEKIADAYIDFALQYPRILEKAVDLKSDLTKKEQLIDLYNTIAECTSYASSTRLHDLIMGRREVKLTLDETFETLGLN